jgi:hypothetical protein
MQQPDMSNTKHARKLTDRRIAFPVAVMVLQLVAAIFFVIDGIEDQIAEARQGFSLDAAMESFIALALLGGIILSSRYIVGLTRELRWKEQSLANARGALAEHITVRFGEWGLTPGAVCAERLRCLRNCAIAWRGRRNGAFAIEPSLHKGRSYKSGNAGLAVHR